MYGIMSTGRLPGARHRLRECAEFCIDYTAGYIDLMQ